jgi:alanine dehydrogenase
MSEVRFLSHEDIDGLVSTAEYVDAVHEGYVDHGGGATTEPRTALPGEDPPGMLNNYIAILPGLGVAGGYTYMAGFGSADAWLVASLFDAQSGEPLAVLDGSAINTYKTGAAGAVGIDALARPDARVLSVFGSGAQARGQVRAAVEVRAFEELLVYSPTPAHRESFAEMAGERFGLESRAVESPSAAVSAADVLITATNASEPVFDAADLKPGTHVTAIGQYDPEKREIPGSVLEQATYVPDLRARARQDAGSFLLAVEEGHIESDHIHAELGEVLAGTAPGRTSAEQITIFDSGGTAIETVASMSAVYRRALETDRGTSLPFTPASEAYTGKRHSTADELE